MFREWSLWESCVWGWRLWRRTETKEQEKHVGGEYGMSAKKEEKTIKIQHWKVIALYLMIYDIFAVIFLIFWDCGCVLIYAIPTFRENYLHAFLKFAPVYTIAVLVIFYFLHLYNSLWRFASFNELNRILAATMDHNGDPGSRYYGDF